MPKFATPISTQILSARPLENLAKLNLGSGPDIHPDYLNLDLCPFPGVDIQHDIRQRWPFPDERFTEIHANHVLEHCSNLIFLMNEAFRVLRHKGILQISVPYWAGSWQRGDPQHVHEFDHNSFAPFSTWYDRYKHQGIKGPWQLIEQTFQLDPNAKDPAYHHKYGFSEILAIQVFLSKP
jgi:SAM-dependent methyltransferase